MGVLTEICQRESSHGQQYEIKHIEQAVLHNLVGTYAATVQDDASRNGAGKIAQTEKEPKSEAMFRQILFVLNVSSI